MASSLMEQFRTDLSSWLISLGAGKLSTEFFNLVNNIGSARSKQEESLIIRKEAELLQATINKPENTRMMREFLIRALYCEMLGQPVPFAYIHALNMTQSQRLLDKRVGYLCTSLFLHENHELLLLLLNSVRKDLESTNVLEVSGALSCMSWLLNGETVDAILPIILEKVKSPNEMIRKKAVLLLLRCIQRNIATWSEVESTLRSKLCDPDPSVMSATLHSFLHVIKLKHTDPIHYSYLPSLVNLVPSFVGILKQIIEKRLPSSYFHYNIQAPWVQISLIKALKYLGQEEPSCIINMTQVFQTILTIPAEKMPARAVVYETILTICSLPQVDRGLLDLCAKNISVFMGSSSSDLNYLGLTLLAKIVIINPIYAAQHQALLISCLESNDDSIRSKTINLLYHMTNVKNVKVITEKLLQRLELSTETFLRVELVNKITHLCEKYSTDNYWFITTMNKVFMAAGYDVPLETAFKFIRLISEGFGQNDEVNTELRVHAVDAYIEHASSDGFLSDPMIITIAWVLGEYGFLIENSTVIADTLLDLLERPTTRKPTKLAGICSNDCKQWIVSAIGKHVAVTGVLNLNVQEALRKLFGSDNLELSRRSQELLSVLTEALRSKNKVEEIFPLDASSEDIVPSEILAEKLSKFVQQSLANGASPYQNNLVTNLMGMTKTTKEDKQLRWKAYERPAEPTRAQASPLNTINSPAKYNPLMTNVTTVPTSPSTIATNTNVTQQQPTSLASLASKMGGPWSTTGFGRPSSPTLSHTTNSPSNTVKPSSITINQPHPTSSPLATNNFKSTNSPSSLMTMDPFVSQLDSKQIQLANDLFSGVTDEPSQSPINTVKSAGRVDPRKRFVKPSTPSHDTQVNLLDLPMDISNPSSQTSTNSSDLNDLLGLGTLNLNSNRSTGPSHPPLNSSNSLIDDFIPSSSVQPVSTGLGSVQAPKQAEVDFLNDFHPTSLNSPSSPSVMEFTQQSSGAASSTSDTIAIQIKPDRDNWNLSNLKGGQLDQLGFALNAPLTPLVNDAFLIVSYLKVWTSWGLHLVLLYGNRTTLKIQKLSSKIQFSTGLKSQLGRQILTNPLDQEWSELEPHFAGILALRVALEGKMTMNLAVSSETTFQVHGQTKTVKYRIPVDFRDLVDPVSVSVDQFGAIWTNETLREVKERVVSGNIVSSAQDLASLLEKHQIGVVQVAKNEIVATCALKTAPADLESIESKSKREYFTNTIRDVSDLLLLHFRLEVGSLVDITLRSQNHTLAEVGGRYLENVLA